MSAVDQRRGSSEPASGVAASLLGQPVRHRELRLGTVSAVLVSADDATVLGMVVSSAWGGPDGLLPLPAALVAADHIECTPLAFLPEADAAFYERRGARRVSSREGYGKMRRRLERPRPG